MTTTTYGATITTPTGQVLTVQADGIASTGTCSRCRPCTGSAVWACHGTVRHDVRVRARTPSAQRRRMAVARLPQPCACMQYREAMPNTHAPVPDDGDRPAWGDDTEEDYDRERG